ncbi:acyl-CoA-binding protein [Hyaloraphidium curvatum]|nr:acyl-CoA-binding protein [Hyaloraphidium curvatum]
MSTDFEKAAAESKSLTGLSNDELLALYALFKQATEGDCNTTRPGFTDFKGKAKWDAWNAKKGVSKEDAAKEYVELVAKLKAKQ